MVQDRWVEALSPLLFETGEVRQAWESLCGWRRALKRRGMKDVCVNEKETGGGV